MLPVKYECDIQKVIRVGKTLKKAGYNRMKEITEFPNTFLTDNELQQEVAWYNVGISPVRVT